MREFLRSPEKYLRNLNGVFVPRDNENEKEKGRAAGPDLLALDGEAFIERLWRHALGRKPKSEERVIAREAIRSAGNAQGKKDVLWMVLMLPEFQLLF